MMQIEGKGEEQRVRNGVQHDMKDWSNWKNEMTVKEDTSFKENYI